MALTSRDAVRRLSLGEVVHEAEGPERGCSCIDDRPGAQLWVGPEEHPHHPVAPWRLFQPSVGDLAAGTSWAQGSRGRPKDVHVLIEVLLDGLHVEDRAARRVVGRRAAEH